MRKPNSVVLVTIGPLVARGLDACTTYLTFDDFTANDLPSNGVIPGTHASTILPAGVTARFRY